MYMTVKQQGICWSVPACCDPVEFLTGAFLKQSERLFGQAKHTAKSTRVNRGMRVAIHGKGYILGKCRKAHRQKACFAYSALEEAKFQPVNQDSE